MSAIGWGRYWPAARLINNLGLPNEVILMQQEKGHRMSSSNTIVRPVLVLIAANVALIGCSGEGSTTGQAAAPKTEDAGAESVWMVAKDVVSKLDETTLQKIALTTGGKYYHATSGEMELEKIYSEISKMEKKELEGKLMTQYEDRYQIFIFLAIVCLTVEFLLSERRGRGYVEKLKTRTRSEAGTV